MNNFKIIKTFIILVASSLLILLLNSLSPKRDFVLTEKNGVIYKKSTESLAGESILLDSQKRYFEDKTGKYELYSNKKIGLSFLHPKELIQTQTPLQGFEEHFTLSPILTQEIFSYPGRLTNPETTEQSYSFSIRLIIFNGDLINSEIWFEQFQNQDELIKRFININNTDFIKYQKAFGQNYNTTVFSSKDKKIVMFLLKAKNKESYQIGEGMLKIIMETFTWL